jgi:mono/diheme cytochrome c family protein
MPVVNAEAVMTKSILLFIAAGLITLAPAGAAAQQGTAPARNTPAKPAAETLARAKNIYQIDCALCHGDNGNGKTDLATSMELKLDDWTDPSSLVGHSDSDLFSVIRNGKDKMPPEDPGRAKDDDIKNLVLYIRTFSKGQPPSAAAADAK